LVCLSSELAAQDLLTSAKELRHCDDETVAKTVYINADLSPSEAKLAYKHHQIVDTDCRLSPLSVII